MPPGFIRLHYNIQRHGRPHLVPFTHGSASVVDIALMPGFTIQPNSELKNPLGCVCSTCWAKEPFALGLASTRNKQMCLQHQGSVALWDLGRCRLQALQSICRANPSPTVSLPSHPVFRLACTRSWDLTVILQG